MTRTLHPTTAFMVAVLALIVAWEVCALVALPYGYTISHRIWAWSRDSPVAVRAAYLALVTAGYLHFFGLPKPF